ncbi:tRNA pseudouridine(55) synthase TruB [bacterium]|nr:MAG: tRNA pseudouridine(55) synthase TruB [bacterium]
MEDGVLLVDKKKGITSFRVVQLIKRKYRLKKIGHAGTLDPMAEGLLVILIGKATRLMDYIGEYKEYIGTLKLGVKTDTDDIEGKVIEEKEVPDLDEKRIRAVLREFIGEIEQRVPLYSAVKIKGKRLYELARKGIPVEPPVRKVFVKSIEFISWEKPFLTLRFFLKKGAYVRALARDIGDKLGCGAHLYALKRTYVSPYRLENAYTLDEILEGRYELIPLDHAVPHLPSATLSREKAWLFCHGGRIEGFYPPGIYAVRDPEGHLIGIGSGHVRDIKPEKVLR